MEGPSLVIACEEFAPFLGKKVKAAAGTANLPFDKISRMKLVDVRSWGKHFILIFDKIQLRIHFLMFGSYRIDNERENRDPKMALEFANGTIYFYSCAIKPIEGDIDDLYDWSIDIMSDEWDAAKAVKNVRARGKEMVCDVLMDQKVFSGLGNIIKNEVLFNLRMHPESKVEDLSAIEQRKLVNEARSYSLQFYEWKKQNVLKRN